MKIFLDTAETDVVRKHFKTGLIDGLTTNPSLIRKSGRKHEEVYQEFKDIGLKDISMEVIGNAENMISEGKRLHKKFGKVATIKVPCTVDGLAACKEWVCSVSEEMRAVPNQDETRGEFFSLWALQAMVIGLVCGEADLRDWLQGVSPLDVKPIETLQSEVHHLGIHATRAWGCAVAFGATGLPEWREAYLKHLNASIALHGSWSENAYAYGHWVPQFTVYAVYLGVVCRV